MSRDEERPLRALITGGTRGIGRAVAVKLAGKSDMVFLNYLQNGSAAKDAKAIVESDACRAILLRNNLAYADQIDAMFGEIRSHTDRIDVFVHCAALNTFKPVAELKAQQWDLIVNANARSFLLCAQQCVPLMKEGAIVALSSLGSVRAVPNYGGLGPAKAALESLVRCLAVELSPRGIRVNGVSAGLVDTESVTKFPESERVVREAVLRTPARRIAAPGEIADVVMFLAGPDSRWICGQTILADGGYSLG
jgi:enoyl-[acyl-carrier protein] reductase III